jgi:predicted transcriptional regulator
MNPTNKELKLRAVVAAKERLVGGIPQWMLERGYSEKEIADLMELRRKAFPATR